MALRKDKEAIESERDSLKLIVNESSGINQKAGASDLAGSQYWNEFSRLANLAVSSYPDWKVSQKRIQKSGNLQEWLTDTVGANNREAEIIKKILSDYYQELR